MPYSDIVEARRKAASLRDIKARMYRRHEEQHAQWKADAAIYRMVNDLFANRLAQAQRAVPTEGDGNGE
jgi:hypothetical protein